MTLGDPKRVPGQVPYERPVSGSLIVRLENGDEWPATADDLSRFRYVSQDAVRHYFRERLYDAIKGAYPEGTRPGFRDTALAPVADLLDQIVWGNGTDVDPDTMSQIAHVERDAFSARMPQVEAGP